MTPLLLSTHLQRLIGVHRRHKRLRFFGGLRDLEDDRTMNFYNIEEDDVLEMTLRIQGGGKRGRTEMISKRLAMAQIHGGVELLFATACDEVRQERRRMDDDYRSWDFCGPSSM